MQIVLIHGLCASIEKCVRIALNIMEIYSGITYTIKTSSQEITENKLHDTTKEMSITKKIKSGIHIELKK